MVSGYYVNEAVRKMYGIPLSQLTPEQREILRQDGIRRATDTPLTTLLMGRGAVVPATDITVTWRERKLNETRGTLKLEGAEAGDPIKSSRSTLFGSCISLEYIKRSDYKGLRRQ